MKDIYRTMANQNILNFYGTKLDLKVDYSELYDFELCKVTNDYDISLLDLSTPISHTGLTFNSQCITGDTLDNLKSLVFLIGTGQTGNTCETIVRRRTEKGWTLDFVLNRDSNPWSGGTTFYYWGISGETNQSYYADNNLSFSFTNDGRVKWESYRYSGVCHTTSGYTESYYISSGQTPVLCTSGTLLDFNLTIVFERNNQYIDCEIENYGGWNDLIRGPHPIPYTGETGTTSTQILTGYTITTSVKDWLTGATINEEFVEELNKKWSNERYNRLGTLKIYLNGKVIYKLKDWEEIIPSYRKSENEIVQVFGGGTTGYNNIHTGNTQFNMLQVKYFEEPLKFPYVRHHYLTSIKPNYNISECNNPCVETGISGYSNVGLLTELGDYILTEDNNIIVY
jgi:hypothetical protein